MVKIEIEIREAVDGFIFENNWNDEERFFKTYEEAVGKANEILADFKKDELDSTE